MVPAEPLRVNVQRLDLARRIDRRGEYAFGMPQAVSDHVHVITREQLNSHAALYCP
jgi:hypothetical protein